MTEKRLWEIFDREVEMRQYEDALFVIELINRFHETWRNEE